MARNVPVAHQSEESGGYMISVNRGEPYFTDIIKLWKVHQGAKHTLAAPATSGLDIVADFARHFPEDCQ